MMVKIYFKREEKKIKDSLFLSFYFLINTVKNTDITQGKDFSQQITG